MDITNAINNVIKTKAAMDAAYDAWCNRIEELDDIDVDWIDDVQAKIESTKHAIAQIEYSMAVYSLYPLAMERCTRLAVEELQNELKQLEDILKGKYSG